MTHQPGPSLSLTRRRLFATTAATAAVAAGSSALGGATAQAASTVPGTQGLPKGLANGFASPGLATAAGFRWWWPHGKVDPVEVAREVDQVADAGFGILEVADVTHSLRARNISIDLTTHGWGTPAWVAGVKAALRRAAERGVRVDITVGPSWPAAVSTITPDDDAACTELAHGRADVAAGATYDGPVPPPVAHASSAVSRQDLLAVQAFRVGATDRNGTRLYADSLVDLTDAVADGRLRWTAPADGAWVVLSYWVRGSAQEPEAGPHTEPRSWVVDHFSAAGSQAVIDLWRDGILDQELRSLLAQAGGYLFEDSLEIETEATIWTRRMPAEFRARAGYDVLPWLAVLVEHDEKYPFTFGGTETTRARDDFNQVLSDLYRDHHLMPLQGFARSLGLGLRVQPYGLETDTIEHSALLDQPETESLGFKNLDDYRVMAGGRDIRGHAVLSCEAACYFGAAYQTTWDRALQTLNSIFAAGVNQTVLHGFAYADAPGVTWPGFAAFSPYYSGAVGYGEAWGPRTPQWQHMPDVAGYLARTQLVLQSGAAKYDLVFLRQKGWASTGIGPFWAVNGGIPIGWSHSFITSALLDLPGVEVRDGVLAPDGPAYKAMIVGPDQFRGQEVTIEVAAARRLRDFARAGLPVVLLGNWSTVQPVGIAAPGETEEVRALLAEVAAQPTTRTVSDQAQIPTALAELGVERDVVHDSSTVMHVRRTLDGADLYYLANAKHAENRRLQRVTQDVWLSATEPDAVPLLLDPWSGTVAPVGLWAREGGRIRVRVDLRPGQSTVIALVPPRGPAPVGATSTTAEAVRVEARSVVVRTTTPGTVVTTLQDGRTVRSRVDRVREPLALTDWDLEIEDWQPGASATETVKPVRSVRLAGLAPWSQVPGLEDVAGIGRYRTTVDLGRDWTAEDGALLELGEVNDTFRVRVNGHDVGPCDPLGPTVDVGPWLRAGTNTIEVEVASTLINRLRTVTPQVYGGVARQAFGLIGPARLVPYAERRIAPGAGR